MVEIDHPRATSLPSPLQPPSQFANPAGAWDQFARRGVPGEVIDQLRPLGLVHERTGRRQKFRRFDDGDRDRSNHDFDYTNGLCIAIGFMVQ